MAFQCARYLDIQERPSKFVDSWCMQINCTVVAQLCQNDGLRSVMDPITNILCWLSRSRRQYNQYPLTNISLSLSLSLSLNMILASTPPSLFDLSNPKELKHPCSSTANPSHQHHLSLSLSQHKATMWTQSFQTLMEF